MKCLRSGWFLLLLMINLSVLRAQEKDNAFNKINFYKAMQGDDEAAVNNQLELLKTADMGEKTAYEGALLMKKAGIVGGPKKKLDLFKDGHKKLEAALSKDTANTEYRFLRLMIQEHAPGILGYKDDIEKDSRFIKANYKKLPSPVQQAVVSYTKASKTLKGSDF